MLEAGRDYLHAHPQSTACPLCASEENIAGLAAEIDAQLKALSRLSAANANKNAQQAALRKAKTALAQAQADCEQAVSTFTDGPDQSPMEGECAISCSSAAG